MPLRIIALYFLLFFSGYSFATQALIIDTDADLDDAMAMLYLLQKKEVDIKAISVDCDGASHCDIGAENFKRIVALTKHKPIPIAKGLREQVTSAHDWSRHKFPAKIIADSDALLGAASALPKSRDQTPIGHDAVKLMENVLKNSPDHSIDILALGPLTNLARLAAHNPNLLRKINRVYMMGGAVHVPGNLELLNASKAEWNIYLDPHAAYEFFHSGVDIHLVSLDVTNKTPVDNAFRKKIIKEKSSEAGKLFSKLIADGNISFFWDPLAAVIASDANLIAAKYDIENIDISEESEETAGATVPLNPADKAGVHVHVYKSVDKEKFEQLLWRVINNGETRPVADIVA